MRKSKELDKSCLCLECSARCDVTEHESQQVLLWHNYSELKLDTCVLVSAAGDHGILVLLLLTEQSE